MKEKVVNLLENAERTIGILMLEVNRLNVEIDAMKPRELTDKEILEFRDKVPYTLSSDLIDFARAILKKAGEK